MCVCVYQYVSPQEGVYSTRLPDNLSTVVAESVLSANSCIHYNTHVLYCEWYIKYIAMYLMEWSVGLGRGGKHSSFQSDACSATADCWHSNVLLLGNMYTVIYGFLYTLFILYVMLLQVDLTNQTHSH